MLLFSNLLYCTLYHEKHCYGSDLSLFNNRLYKSARVTIITSRIICTNFDVIYYRGIDLVRELQWLSISQRINYFLCVLVFNCIRGNAPHYLSESIDMASHIMHDKTRLDMSSDVNVSLGRTH